MGVAENWGPLHVISGFLWVSLLPSKKGSPISENPPICPKMHDLEAQPLVQVVDFAGRTLADARLSDVSLFIWARSTQLPIRQHSVVFPIKLKQVRRRLESARGNYPKGRGPRAQTKS